VAGDAASVQAGPPLILVLRPQPGAARTAARLAAHGLKATVLPLTVIEPLQAAPPVAPPAAASADALVFSSQNGVRHGAAALAAVKALPAFCVGAQTARAARARGFDVVADASTASALVPLVAASGVRSVIYACGRNRRPDIEQGLARAAIGCTLHECYAAAPAAGAMDALAAMLAQGPRAFLLLHAPSAAAALEPVEEAVAAARAALLCLSQAVREAVPERLRALALAAAEPDDASLTDLLRATLDDRLFVAADMQEP
jgi:uroporphyrinogen-III synthase